MLELNQLLIHPHRNEERRDESENEIDDRHASRSFLIHRTTFDEFDEGMGNISDVKLDVKANSERKFIDWRRLISKESFVSKTRDFTLEVPIDG